MKLSRRSPSTSSAAVAAFRVILCNRAKRLQLVEPFILPDPSCIYFHRVPELQSPFGNVHLSGKQPVVCFFVRPSHGSRYVIGGGAPKNPVAAGAPMSHKEETWFAAMNRFLASRPGRGSFWQLASSCTRIYASFSGSCIRKACCAVAAAGKLLFMSLLTTQIKGDLI